MNYRDFFVTVTRHQPFSYQERLAKESWPELLDIPTGMGKTAAVIVAWLYKKLNGDAETPRRLVYCLPMRVLVEQTQSNIDAWLEKAAPYFYEKGVPLPKVHLIMGGENDAKWAEHPEKPAIIIGTQDMLLSRALMRGYGMSRFQWPVQFAFLHNDAFWIFDEIQLMGAGLPTSAQLEAFRRRFSVASTSRTLWVSATLNPDWLATVDMRPYLEKAHQLKLTADESKHPSLQTRLAAMKRLNKAATTLTTENQKQSSKIYSEALAQEILNRHVDGTNTLAIMNTVERAQSLTNALVKKKPSVDLMLVHSRFRAQERSLLNSRLSEIPSANGPGRIIVATQAVEAGVDITSRTLFTELAPWSSLVQRFGRCNRYGEANENGGADVFWIDFEEGGKLELPYEQEALTNARNRLNQLESASAADLPAIDEKAPLHAVLRARDFRDLFNTDPDLSGFDVDVSSYIRDADDLDVQFFWRDLAQGVDEQPQPQREELCRASIGQAKILIERIRKLEIRAYRWDGLDGKWRNYQGTIRPGLVLMLDSKVGGYVDSLGFAASSTKAVNPVSCPESASSPEIYGDDWRSRHSVVVELYRHLTDTEAYADQLCQALGMAEGKTEVLKAARWHDVGKSHTVFQATMHDCPAEEAGGKLPLLAKSASKRRHQRNQFRHELASMLAWLEHGGATDNSDLIAYLIAAHHGKVRLSLRAMPDEKEPAKPFGPRFARGVWEGDELPAIEITQGESVPPTRIRLDIMEIGEGSMGQSWTARTQKLLDLYGPFRLAWLESLVRIADWRASADEQEVKP